MKKMIFLLFLVFIIACTQIEVTEEDRFTCNVDADCEIKDVGNCCGYFPRCVNVDYFPDLEAVQQECEEQGIASVCGFPEITHCTCVQNTCTSNQGDAVV